MISVTHFHGVAIKSFFFDDNLDNLWTAKFFGWNTVWITPSSQETHDFVDATYPNIFEALLRFQKKI